MSSDQLRAGGVSFSDEVVVWGVLAVLAGGYLIFTSRRKSEAISKRFSGVRRLLMGRKGKKKEAG